jgi:hypothetical protein
MVALVDEATGYQKDRAHDELQRILEAYVLPKLGHSDFKRPPSARRLRRRRHGRAPARRRTGSVPFRGAFEHRGKEEAMKLVLILAGLIGLYALLLRTGNPTAALVLTTAAGVIAAVIAGLMREANDF